MTMELDREVSLTRDLSEYGLRAGDIVMLNSLKNRSPTSTLVSAK